MINSTIAIPNETWNLIINSCSDLNSIINLSQINKQVHELALKMLESIKINRDKICADLYKVQDLYTIKYRNIDPGNASVMNLGKFILLEIHIKNGLAYFEDLKTINSDLADLEKNQMLITPNFGDKEIGKFLPENNPNYIFFGLGLDSQADSIAQDRLPIKKITIKSNISNPHLLISVELATDRVNRLFYKLNGSYTDYITGLW